jgi:hypothetical protein
VLVISRLVGGAAIKLLTELCIIWRVQMIQLSTHAIVQVGCQQVDLMDLINNRVLRMQWAVSSVLCSSPPVMPELITHDSMITEHQKKSVMSKCVRPMPGFVGLVDIRGMGVNLRKGEVFKTIEGTASSVGSLGFLFLVGVILASRY